MTNELHIPYRGELLVTQLAAYGLAGVLDAAGQRSWIHHDADSLSYQVAVVTTADDARVAEIVRASAVDAESAVEHDIEAGTIGISRRPSLWPRATFLKDNRPDMARADLAQSQQTDRLRAAESANDRGLADLLTGLGMAAVWLPEKRGAEKLGPSKGATALDGVLGNNTSDFVRAVLRRSCNAVIARSSTEIAMALRGSVDAMQTDHTGWAPPGTTVDLLFQWLAALGTAAFPVAHQADGPSITPSAWRRSRPSRRGVTLPILDVPTSYPRARAIVNLHALAALGRGDDTTAGPTLRSFGVTEALEFAAEFKPGGGSSVAFSFSTAQRVYV